MTRCVLFNRSRYFSRTRVTQDGVRTGGGASYAFLIFCVVEMRNSSSCRANSCSLKRIIYQYSYISTKKKIYFRFRYWDVMLRCCDCDLSYTGNVTCHLSQREILGGGHVNTMESAKESFSGAIKMS